MFQSRNRESYLFKRMKCLKIGGIPTLNCFNLAIENLIFSRQLDMVKPRTFHVRFNLVIENLIFSSSRNSERWSRHSKFQSRNRESYLFKVYLRFQAVDLSGAAHSFNLAIENLIFSSLPVETQPIFAASPGFNLAIENLIFSSLRPQKRDGTTDPVGHVSISQSRILSFQALAVAA